SPPRARAANIVDGGSWVAAPALSNRRRDRRPRRPAGVRPAPPAVLEPAVAAEDESVEPAAGARREGRRAGAVGAEVDPTGPAGARPFLFFVMEVPVAAARHHLQARFAQRHRRRAGEGAAVIEPLRPSAAGAVLPFVEEVPVQAERHDF